MAIALTKQEVFGLDPAPAGPVQHRLQVLLAKVGEGVRLAYAAPPAFQQVEDARKGKIPGIIAGNADVHCGNVSYTRIRSPFGSKKGVSTTVADRFPVSARMVSALPISLHSTGT